MILKLPLTEMVFILHLSERRKLLFKIIVENAKSVGGIVKGFPTLHVERLRVVDNGHGFFKHFGAAKWRHRVHVYSDY